MKKEDKELLLKDLCARLPYGTMLNISVNLFTDETFNARISTIDYCGEIKVRYGFEEYEQIFSLEQIKPYLFPLSSMSDEQKEEWRGIRWSKLPWEELDWLHKGHWDYRGLIPKGLAIDATGKNIY